LNDLLGAEVSSSSFDLIEEGTYNGVITGAEVRPGQKAPYINLEVTIHDEGLRGRKVWRTCSFSEKALNMPGGVANLVQTTKPDIDPSTPAEALPAAIAEAVISSPVTIEVEHEQIKRQGVAQFNADGTPEMRAQIKTLIEPDEAFVTQIENEIAGVDDDLPF
jgi:hypothetical protein